METNKPGSTNASQPTSADIKNTLSSAFDTVDASSTDVIHNLNLVQKAHLSRLQRNVTALKQAGVTGAAIQNAQGAVQAGTQRVAQLSALHQQAATPVQAVTDNGWVLQGRVFNSTLSPVEHLTVFLVDANKNWQSAYGFAYTDSTGYFVINYPADSESDSNVQPVSATKSKSNLKSADASESQRATATPADSQSQTRTDLFIEIANANGKPIYLSTDAFSPAPGSTTYLNITLPVGEKPIGDPPPFIREAALPKRKKK
jgi:hypothetical protein